MIQTINLIMKIMINKKATLIKQFWNKMCIKKIIVFNKFQFAITHFNKARHLK